MLILAFGNKARHGKDTAGEAVVRHFNEMRALSEKHRGVANPRPAAMLFKFAEALYKECREQHGMTEKDPVLLQRIGQARRQENENYWVDQTFAQIDKVNPEAAVITDVRYRNEAAAITNRGGFVINVSRLNCDGSPYISDDRPANHPSETDLDGYSFDFFIKAYTGDAPVVEEQAITIAHYARSLKS